MRRRVRGYFVRPRKSGCGSAALPVFARRFSIFQTLTSVVSHLRIDNRRDPLTRLASADEDASSSHPLPQGGEGSKINSPLAPLGERGWG